MKKRRRQSLDNQQGEVRFRETLSKQLLSRQEALADFYSKDFTDAALVDKFKRTLVDLEFIMKSRGNPPISPFLELGAERGHRSLALTNDYGAEGFIIDISHHQLKTVGYYANLLKRTTLPKIVCCDAYNLPFRNNAFPFVFCYEFLHHFPDPNPIIREIYRVLGDGIFFFGGEPYRKWRVELTTRKLDQTGEKRSYKYLSFMANVIVDFFSRPISKEERDYGIVENDDIRVADWIESVRIFDERNLYLISLGEERPFALADRVKPLNWINLLLGGYIKGLCRKRGPAQSPPSSIDDLLACPACRSGADGTVDPPGLSRVDGRYACRECGDVFPEVDGISLLMTRNKRNELYPEYRNIDT